MDLLPPRGALLSMGNPGFSWKNWVHPHILEVMKYRKSHRILLNNQGFLSLFISLQQFNIFYAETAYWKILAVLKANVWFMLGWWGNVDIILVYVGGSQISIAKWQLHQDKDINIFNDLTCRWEIPFDDSLFYTLCCFKGTRSCVYLQNQQLVLYNSKLFRQFPTSAAPPHLLHACNDARTFGNLSKRRSNKMKTTRHEQRLRDNPT